MKLETAVATYSKNSTLANNTVESPVSAVARSNTLTGVAKSNEAATTQNISVTISGRALMFSRLFSNQDASAQPPVLSSLGGLTGDLLHSSPVSFLTEKDRSLISDMYAYTQQQGGDLQYVDTLAVTLGSYRQFGNGQYITGFNEGTSFDLEGHQTTSSYSAKDSGTVARISTGDAIASTKIDHGFLSWVLNSTNVLGNGANMDFLEQMVNKFSDKGADTTALDAKFRRYSGYDSASYNVVITASKEIINKNPAIKAANSDTKLNPSEQPVWQQSGALLNQLSSGASKFDLTSLKNSGLNANQFVKATLNTQIMSVAFLAPNQIAANGSVLSRLLDVVSNSEDTNKF